MVACTAYLQLDPVEEAQSGGSGRPIKDLTQLIQEWHRGKELEAQPADHPRGSGEHIGVPSPTTPAKENIWHPYAR